LSAKPKPKLRQGEFVALMALMMSLVAMAIDAMLPALAQIGDELGAGHANQAQLVISALLLGMAAGQVIYGPLSDSIGRKPTIYAGLALFVIGSALSLAATSFAVMLLARIGGQSSACCWHSVWSGWSGSPCASRRPCRSSGAPGSRSQGSWSAYARPAPTAWRSATPSPPA
jgi:MFS family permease